MGSSYWMSSWMLRTANVELWFVQIMAFIFSPSSTVISVGLVLRYASRWQCLIGKQRISRVRLNRNSRCRQEQ